MIVVDWTIEDRHPEFISQRKIPLSELCGSKRNLLLVAKLDFSRTLEIKKKLGQGKMLEYKKFQEYKYLQDEFQDTVFYHYQPYVDTLGEKSFRNIYTEVTKTFWYFSVFSHR